MASPEEPGLDSLDSALRMRSVIRGIVAEELELTRPQPRYGRVASVSRRAGFVGVVFPGDDTEVPVSVTKSTQPSDSYAELGNIVRVDGPSGAPYVAEVMSGGGFLVEPTLYNPVLSGDEDSDYARVFASFDTVSCPLPAVGSTQHLGRWVKTQSLASTLLLEVTFNWTRFKTGHAKRYCVGLINGMTAGEWVKLMPVAESGNQRTSVVSTLEIKVESNGGFELRARLHELPYPNPPAGSGWDFSIWINTDRVTRDPDSGLGEQVTTEPSTYLGMKDKTAQKGPGLSSNYHLPIRLQFNLMGGSRVNWNGSRLSWNEPFLASGCGLGPHAKNGAFDVTMPAVGVQIPYVGSTEFTFTAVDSSGILMARDDVLYYVPPLGGLRASVPANFVKVLRTSNFEVPSHWLMVAAKTDQGGPSLKLGTGELLDHWRNLVLINGWIQNTTFYPDSEPQYKIVDGRLVAFKGVIHNSNDATRDSVFANIPITYRPISYRGFVAATIGGTVGQVEILPNGDMRTYGLVTGAGQFVALSSILYALS